MGRKRRDTCNGSATPATALHGVSPLTPDVSPLTPEEVASLAARHLKLKADAAFHFVVLNRVNAIYRAKRYRRCRMCSKRTPSMELVQIKPMGDTRYYRFCQTFAAELTKAKALARALRPKRRWGKGAP